MGRTPSRLPQDPRSVSLFTASFVRLTAAGGGTKPPAQGGKELPRWQGEWSRVLALSPGTPPQPVPVWPSSAQAGVGGMGSDTQPLPFGSWGDS